MDKKEIVKTTLEKYSCVNAKTLAMFIRREHGIDMTPSSVAGVLRGLYAKGIVARSNCGFGSTVYWVRK